VLKAALDPKGLKALPVLLDPKEKKDQQDQQDQ